MSTKRETAARLALLLGCLGTHKFYQGDIFAGFLYLIFFWTCIPAILAVVDFLLILFTSEQDYDKRFA